MLGAYSSPTSIMAICLAVDSSSSSDSSLAARKRSLKVGKCLMFTMFLKNRSNSHRASLMSLLLLLLLRRPENPTIPLLRSHLSWMGRQVDRLFGQPASASHAWCHNFRGGRLETDPCFCRDVTNQWRSRGEGRRP